MPTFDRIPEVPTELENYHWSFLTAVKDTIEKLVGYFESIDDTWIWAILENSWEHYGSPYSPVRYRKKPNNIVYFTGVAKSGTVGQTLFVLPVSYRPAFDLIVPVVSNGVLGVCTIKATGEVEATSGNNTYFSLDGISFQT